MSVARPAEQLRSGGRAARVRSRAAVAGVSFAVLFWGSWRPAWSADETATIMVARRSWGEVLRTFWYDSPLEPYYLVMRAWGSVSTSHVWMRLPSVLAMAAAVTMTWSLTRRLAGPQAAWFAAAVLLCLPATSAYAQDARPYAAGVLIVAALVSYWTRVDGRSPAGATRRLCALIVLAGLAHPYALAVVPALLVASLALGRARLRTTVRASAIALAVLAPFLGVVAVRATGAPNTPGLTLTNVLVTAQRLPAERLTLPHALLTSRLAWVAAAAGLLLHLATRGERERRTVAVVAGWLLGPPLLLCLLQAVTTSPGLVSRYWLFSLPALAVAAALAFTRPDRRIAAIGATLVLALLITGWPSQASTRSVNGHLGQGWVLLPRVLDLPALRTSPLLTASWNYHGLVANDPGLRARMPLVLDPDPDGRIVPRTVGTGSAAYTALVQQHDRVVVLATARHANAPIPAARAFERFGPQLRAFPRLVLACAWFDQALGVFSTATAGTADVATLRRQVVAIAPAQVRCATVGRPRMAHA